MTYALRPAIASDEPFLWQMLYYAAHMDESGEPLESAGFNPDLAPYVQGFGILGDLGIIASDATNGIAAGAAWIRVMPAGWALHRFIDAAIPELAIAVTPAHIGRGAGSQMLARLLADASPFYPAVALSVRENNPARALYERTGFATVATIANRVGGESLVMRATLVRSR
jgi:ribosomal protein S18 acetylase RimI-like enzyme